MCSASTISVLRPPRNETPTGESATSSPARSPAPTRDGPQPTTPIRPPYFDDSQGVRQRPSRKNLKNVKPIQWQDRSPNAEGSTTKASLTDATAGSSPMPAPIPLLIDGQVFRGRDAAFAEAKTTALGLPPTPQRGLKPRQSKSDLPSQQGGGQVQRDFQRAQSKSRSLSAFTGVSHPQQAGPFSSPPPIRQPSHKRSLTRDDLTTGFPQRGHPHHQQDQPQQQRGQPQQQRGQPPLPQGQLPQRQAQPAARSSQTVERQVSEFDDNEEERYGPPMRTSTPGPKRGDVDVD